MEHRAEFCPTCMQPIRAAVGLTRQQAALLLIIAAYIARDGIPPSFSEMKDALGLKGKSGIHRLIEALDQRGYITRAPHRARAVALTAPGEQFAARHAGAVLAA